MTSMFRTTALAAMLAASFGAAAVPLTVQLDLFQLGEDAKKPAVAGVGQPTGTPVAVGQIQGFSFSSNAFVYHPDMIYVPPSSGPGSGNLPDLAPPTGTQGAFIMNGDRSTLAFAPIEISLGSAFLAEGRYFTGLDTSIFASGPFSIARKSKGQLVGIPYQPTLPNGDWNDWPGFFGGVTPWAATDAIDTIVISAGSTAYFGLQAISLKLSDATTGGGGGGGGGTVPEPGSYALVGLALLAAGAASRKRA